MYPIRINRSELTKVLITATSNEHHEYDLNYVVLNADGSAYAIDGRVFVYVLNHHESFEGNGIYSIGVEFKKSHIKSGLNCLIFNGHPIENAVINGYAPKIKINPHMPDIHKILHNFKGQEYSPLTTMRYGVLDTVKAVECALNKPSDCKIYWVTTQGHKKACLLVHPIEDLIVVGMPQSYHEPEDLQANAAIQTYEKFLGLDPKKLPSEEMETEEDSGHPIEETAA